MKNKNRFFKSNYDNLKIFELKKLDLNSIIKFCWDSFYFKNNKKDKNKGITLYKYSTAFIHKKIFIELYYLNNK